jgi:hypothetical protein
LNAHGSVTVTVTASVSTFNVAGLGSLSGGNVLALAGKALPAVLTSPSSSAAATVCGIGCAGLAPSIGGLSFNCTTTGIVTPEQAVSASQTVTAHTVLPYDDVNQGPGSSGVLNPWSTELAYYQGSYTQLRFSGLTIPFGATITSAKLVLTSSRVAGADGDVTLQIRGLKSTTPGQLGSMPGAISRYFNSSLATAAGLDNLTAASVSWSPSAWRTAGTPYTSPDLTALVKEVIASRPAAVATSWSNDFAPGVTISLIISASAAGAPYTASTGIPLRGRYAQTSKANNVNAAPKIVITYTPPAPSSPTVLTAVAATADPSTQSCPVVVTLNALADLVPTPSCSTLQPQTLSLQATSNAWWPDGTLNYSPDKAVDGDAGTMWLSPSAAWYPTMYYWGGGPWLTLDLGGPTLIASVVTTWWTVPLAFNLQGSTDNATWTTVFAKTADQVLPATIALDPTLVSSRARYLRYQFVTSSEAYHLRYGIYNVIVRGCPLVPNVIAASTANHAPGKTITLGGGVSVSGIVPSRGSTAGGTAVTLFGSGFGSNKKQVSVSLSGAPCAVSQVSNSFVRCLTSPHLPMPNPGSVDVLINGVGYASADTSAGTIWWQYIDRWSAYTTWGGGPPPVAGETLRTVNLKSSFVRVTIQATPLSFLRELPCCSTSRHHRCTH